MTRKLPVPSGVLFVFVDGIGFGDPDPAHNPFVTARDGLLSLSGGVSWSGIPVPPPNGATFRAIDACLGVDGYPQSGTGQATLFTGENCALLAGRHFGPFPHSTSRSALRERSLMAAVAAARGPESVAFANAFPPRFFEVMGSRDRWPVTTRACLDAGIRIRTLDDLALGQAIAADLTGAGLRDLGHEVPVLEPGDTARVALALAAAHAFTLVEIFHTDKAGHARDRRQADRILGDLDSFVGVLVRERPDDLLIVLTSDHGNLEDLRVRTHTRNPVPLAAVGPGARSLASVDSLAGVTPALRRLLLPGVPGG